MARKSPGHWVKEHKRDHYYRAAKGMGYRSRAAFKLKEINQKYNVISRSDTVVDLGAAPGGWSQVAYEIVSGNTDDDEELSSDQIEGMVVALDLKGLKPIEGVKIIRGDITNPTTIEKLLEVIDRAKAVLSDMSPDITGHYSVDQARSVYLAEMAFEFAQKILVPGGNFVAKVFQGEDFKQLFDKVKSNFRFCKTLSPQASRTRSSEIYIVAKGFRKPDNGSHRNRGSGNGNRTTGIDSPLPIPK